MRGIKIDDETRRVAMELYRDNAQKLSVDNVARLLGISDTSVWQILVSNNEPRRSMMKYPKTDFTNDLAEQARIVGFIEDCWAGYDGKQIFVTTSTTHPAQIKLFNEIFGRYGHVNKTPGYNKQFSLYQWQVYVYLNTSFEFVAEYKRNPLKFLREQINKNATMLIYISSFIDAEGSVGIYDDNGYPLAALSISNSSRQLLRRAQKAPGGEIYHDRDGYDLQLHGGQAVEVLRRLPITHEEKAAAKELVLRYADNGGIGLEAFRAYQQLRRRIDEEVRVCTLQARLEWIRRHDKPHRDDSDQTMPEN